MLDVLLKRPEGDILISGGLIRQIGHDLKARELDTLVLDCSRYIVSPALVDVHTHLREPGFESKETIATGSKAAARGGFTTICAMPNLRPAPDCPENLKQETDIIQRDATIEVLPYACITKGRKGQELVDFKSLKESGAVAFSDDGSGVQSEDMMRSAMKAALEAGDYIIAAHCEDNSLLRGGYIHDGTYCHGHGHKGICSESEYGQIARDLKLAEEIGCRYHVCHISTKESVELIREAKKRGVRVTCETAPHYLTLCDEDLQEEGRWKMNPPLRSASDREALIEGLADGTIDVVATDHAPHTAEEKSRGLAGSPFGIVGLETSFPVLFTKLVKTGRLSLERLLEVMSEKPREIFRLEKKAPEVGTRADIVVIDPEAHYRIDSADFLSRGHSTPFDGMEVWGKPILTLKDGQIVWKDLCRK